MITPETIQQAKALAGERRIFRFIGEAETYRSTVWCKAHRQNGVPEHIEVQAFRPDAGKFSEASVAVPTNQLERLD